MKRVISALSLAILLASPAFAKPLTTRYVGHCVKKVLLLPVYMMFATPVAVGVWVEYGGYEKELIRDFSNKILINQYGGIETSVNDDNPSL